MHYTKARHLLGLVALVALAGCGDDSSPNAATEAPLNTTVDFIDLRVEDIGATSATVLFTTSLPTTCEVEFGLAEGDLDQIAEDPSMGPETYDFDHVVPVTGLQPNTTYYYRARGTTADGQTFFSDVRQFTTPEMPPTDAALANVAALGQGAAIADVSSNFGGAANDQTWGADNAIDGDMNTEWATNGDGDGATLTIAFARERTIDRFGFRSRKMPDGSSIITSVRLVFASGDAAETVLGPFDTPDPDQLYTFDIAPVSAARVRVEAVTTTGGNTGAKEIQFFSPGG